MLSAEAVSEREMGVDELPPGTRVGELLAQAADVHVHGPVSRPERPAPGLLRQYFATQHCALVPRERDQETQFVARKVQCGAVKHRHLLRRPHLEWPGLEELRQRGFHVRRLT